MIDMTIKYDRLKKNKGWEITKKITKKVLFQSLYTAPGFTIYILLNSIERVPQYNLNIISLVLACQKKMYVNFLKIAYRFAYQVVFLSKAGAKIWRVYLPSKHICN
jgi:hypothetical protein